MPGKGGEGGFAIVWEGTGMLLGKLQLNPKRDLYRPVQRPFDPLKGLDYTKHASNSRNSLRGKS